MRAGVAGAKREFLEGLGLRVEAADGVGVHAGVPDAALGVDGHLVGIGAGRG
jgi:hypothetical protein